MQADAVEVLGCYRYINDDETAVEHYHLELASANGSTRRRSRVRSVDTWDLSTEEAEALLALARTTVFFDRYGNCRSMRPAPAAAAAAAPPLPQPPPQPLAAAAAALPAVSVVAAPPAPTPAATRIRWDPNETDDSDDEEDDAVVALDAVEVPAAAAAAAEPVVAEPVAAVPMEMEVEEEELSDDVEDEAAETLLVLYEAPSPPARLTAFVPKASARCTRDERCTNVRGHRGKCSIPKVLKPPKPPKAPPKPPKAPPKPPKAPPKPPTKSIGKLPFKCNTLRKTKVVPEVVLGQPVAMPEQTLPPMSATTATATTTVTTTTFQVKLEKALESFEPLVPFMPPKKRGASASWRVQTEVKVEPEPKPLEPPKPVEPRTPELPPQHELTPSLRDLPPLKLDPNPKARPWTTKRQLSPTPEEVDVVEVAKAKAHTRLVMGYAPPNVDHQRRV
jgi:hypothetical protein